MYVNPKLYSYHTILENIIKDHYKHIKFHMESDVKEQLMSQISISEPSDMLYVVL